MATVTIHDEATRKVLLYKLWSAAVSAIGNVENCEGWFDSPPEETRVHRLEVDSRISAYRAVTKLIDEIEGMQIGATVELAESMDVEEAMRSFRQEVEDSPHLLLKAGPTDRERLVGLYDAAGALLPTEAVA